MTFAEELTQIKTESGKTNEQLAKEIGVPLRTFESWKAGVRIPAKYTIEYVLKTLK